MDAQGWVTIIAAIFAGLGTLITAVVAGAILVIQSQHKIDTDKKLEVIRVDVNSNLTQVKAQLEAAVKMLNERDGDHITAEDLLPPRSTV